MNVLLTSVGRRNYLVEYFREALHGKGRICVADVNPFAAATRDADAAFAVPQVCDREYFNVLFELCVREDIRLLLSLNDVELPLLARQRDRFEQAEVRVAVSPPRVIDLCADKLATTAFLEEQGLPVPTTMGSLPETLQCLDSGKIRFPLVVKARWGSGSIGLGTADDRNGLEEAYRRAEHEIRRSLVGNLPQPSESCVVVQSCVRGIEFHLDVVNDLEGNYQATLAKQKLLMRAGETDQAITVDNPELDRLGEMLGKRLGHVGNLDCDVMWGDEGPVIIDLNPRFGGGYPFSHAAGARVVSALLAWATGRPARPEWLRVTEGVRSAKCARIVTFPPVNDDSTATQPAVLRVAATGDDLQQMRHAAEPFLAQHGRIHLSPPHMDGCERALLFQAFDSNWIAPLGPHVNALEDEFTAMIGTGETVAMSSGTAALHMALILLGVGAGDEVLTSTLTFAATANAIIYTGATPVFIDSDRQTWNMDPELLEEELAACAERGRIPKAVIVVDLYGQCADFRRITEVCERYCVPIIEDAAEALGASQYGRPAGSFGRLGCFSLNGNKIITASAGGLLVSQEVQLCRRARFLATQARDPAPHYQHSQIGYNYRMSNLLAAVARGQLQVLDDRVTARRQNFVSYQDALAELPGIDFMPEPEGFFSTRWLTCLTVDPRQFGCDREAIRLHLESQNIESRPVWKPLHLQPAFAGCRHRGGAVAEALFRDGLCLPSGSSLSDEDRHRVVRAIQAVARPGRRTVRSAA